jgi:peptidyl-prolyl cis-trans isomerase SurA
MKRLDRRFALLAIVACAFTARLVSAQGSAPVGATAPATSSGNRMMVERIIVRVNGEIFSQGQMSARQVEALQELKRDGTNLEASLAEITPDILVAAVDELLLVQRGREMGFRFTDEQFKQSLENIKRDNKLDDEGLKVGLAQAGLTLETLRQRLERSFLVSVVQQREVGPSLSITTEEMRQYYEKNRNQFMTPLTVTLRELMIAVPTRVDGGKEAFSAADDAAAKERIEGIRARVLAGANFTQLVSELSESPTKANGGLIGPLNVEDLNATLREHVAPLQLGGVTPVLRGPRGYQIFQLDNRSTPSLKPFDTVRNDIEMAIREERIEPATDKLLERLRGQAVIEWKDENYRKLYEQELAKAAGK